MSEALIQSLQNESLYEHSIEKFEIVETHISWVILTGQFAYKIKKPNDFGFLDFSTLEKRRYFCEEELRLNQRLAPNLYLELISIAGEESSPQFNSDAPAIEYAVKMRQFDQKFLLDRMLDRGELTREHINSIAQKVAAFHQHTQTADAASEFGLPEQVLAPITQNFEQIKPFLTESNDLELLAQIEAWALDTFQILREDIEQRKQQGFVRECHGDLHLGNMTLINEQITLFDCIEFNQEFRIIDVVSEIAFFAMDLESRGLNEFANLFINRYLELTRDYQGLKLLNFYKSYRSMVRAKVALFRLYDASAEDKAGIFAEYRRYASLAQDYMKAPHRFMLMMHGYSGSGKSTVSDSLIEKLGAIRLRSDVLRKQLYSDLVSDSDSNSQLYSQEASDNTFATLARNAGTVLAAGFPVIADATFLKHQYRELMTGVAENQAVAIHIVDCVLEDERIRSRLEKRSLEGADPSDADVGIYEMQLESAEPLSDTELSYTLQVNTRDQKEVALFVEQLENRVS